MAAACQPQVRTTHRMELAHRRNHPAPSDHHSNHLQGCVGSLHWAKQGDVCSIYIWWKNSFVPEESTGTLLRPTLSLLEATTVAATASTLLLCDTAHHLPPQGAPFPRRTSNLQSKHTASTGY
ncbi:Hypothetical predicted protein [Pelobates cultripes]|uniref:Uncharacterized protein n=1 Tax=Pelobates cultripes TaxID=61616 RepID=A0AAD1VLC6_PELCU|nr:Hypothetical predicted protein [Pelobates cultripes]